MVDDWNDFLWILVDPCGFHIQSIYHKNPKFLRVFFFFWPDRPETQRNRPFPFITSIRWPRHGRSTTSPCTFCDWYDPRSTSLGLIPAAVGWLRLISGDATIGHLVREWSLVSLTHGLASLAPRFNVIYDLVFLNISTRKINSARSSAAEAQTGQIDLETKAQAWGRKATARCQLGALGVCSMGCAGGIGRNDHCRELVSQWDNSVPWDFLERCN